MVPRAHPSPQPKRHRKRFTVFAELTIMTDQQTDKTAIHTHYATQSATKACICIVVRCSLIMSCAVLEWKMVQTSHSSVKFIMSVYIKLRNLWMPLVWWYVRMWRSSFLKADSVQSHVRVTLMWCISTLISWWLWPSKKIVCCLLLFVTLA